MYNEIGLSVSLENVWEMKIQENSYVLGISLGPFYERTYSIFLKMYLNTIEALGFLSHFHLLYFHS